MTLDVHNPAAFDSAFRVSSIRLEAREFFAARIRDALNGRDFALVSPDIGGFKRVQLLAELFEGDKAAAISLAVCEKRRSAGVVSGGLFAGDVRGRPAWILDDMIVGGGTMMRATKQCRAHGAQEVHLLATHALLTRATIDDLLAAGADTVTITDSVAPFPEAIADHAAVTCVGIAPLVADCLGEVLGASGPGKKSR